MGFCGIREFCTDICMEGLIMKRKIKFATAIFCIVFAFYGCSLNIYQDENDVTVANKTNETKSWHNTITIEKSEYNYLKDNNNANSGSNVVQINDKIYVELLNYETDKIEFYEISTGKTKLVYTESMYESIHDSLSLNYILDDKILKSADSDSYLNTETGQIVESREKYSPGFGDYVSFINDNERYFWNFTDLYKYENGDYQHVVTNKDLKKDFLPFDFGHFYISESYLYYSNSYNGKTNICCYDLDNKNIAYEVELFDFISSDLDISNIVGIYENVYFKSGNKIYHTNLRNKTTETIFETDGYPNFIYTSNKIYVGVSNGVDSIEEKTGLFEINLTTGEENQLSNEIISEIYVFDNDYIYYTTYSDFNDFQLSRLKLSDESTEILLINQNNSEDLTESFNI